MSLLDRINDAIPNRPGPLPPARGRPRLVVLGELAGVLVALGLMLTGLWAVVVLWALWHSERDRR